MGTPPSPDPPRMTSYLHRAGGLRHQDGTGPMDTYISRKDRCSCGGGHGAGCYRAPGGRLSSTGEGPAEDKGTVCTPTVHPQRNDDWGLSELQHLCTPPCCHRGGRSTGSCLCPPTTFRSHQPGTMRTSSLSSLLSKARARSPVSHHCACEAQTGDTSVPMS